MHMHVAYKELKISNGTLRLAEKLSSEVLSLSVWFGIKGEEINFVIERINNWR